MLCRRGLKGKLLLVCFVFERDNLNHCSLLVSIVVFISKFKHTFRQEQIIDKSPENTHLEHLSKLNIRSPPHLVRKTGIICTIGLWFLISWLIERLLKIHLGPACRSVDMLEKLMEQGMNIARLNFSHGDHEVPIFYLHSKYIFLQCT